MSSTATLYRPWYVRYARYATIASLLSLILFPVAWIILSSVKPDELLFELPVRLIPTEVTFERFRTLLMDPQFRQFFINSFVVSIICTVVSVILAVLAAYGWSKYDFWGSETTSVFVILSRTFPVVVLLVPLFQILSSLQMLDTRFGLIITYFIYTLPLTSWMLKGFFDNIPDNVIQAARIGGLSEFQIFRNISLPLISSGIIATALFSFLIAWQELLFAITFLRSDEKKTLPVALMDMTNQYSIEWGNLMAASFLYMLPIIVLFIFAQRYFIKGIAGGGIE